MIRPTRSGDVSSSVWASPTLASGKRLATRVFAAVAEQLEHGQHVFDPRAPDAEQIEFKTDEIGCGEGQRLAALLACDNDGAAEPRKARVLLGIAIASVSLSPGGSLFCARAASHAASGISSYSSGLGRICRSAQILTI
jgi:hypothetical protein